MDRLIYTTMTGAKQLMRRQELLSQNLANASTPGYRALQAAAESVPVEGNGMKTRAFAKEASLGADFSQGPIQTTGRPLDVAVRGAGFLAVQARDGNEAYTRAGGLMVDANGMLTTLSGMPVQGDGGPIQIPADSRVDIGDDGSVSAAPLNDPKQMSVIGRLKLVNPEPAQLVRGDDGLFRLNDGAPAPNDENVRVTSGSLEGSNVNPIEAMVGMIGVARQYELQLKLLENAQANDRAATQLLSINA